MTRQISKQLTFEEMVEETRRVSGRFLNKYDLRDHFMDLVEEVGELSQALQISSGRKHTNDQSKQRSRADVIDAMSDVLFELVRLAEVLKIDLGVEYMKTLEHINSRIDAGEFTKVKEKDD